MTSKISIVGLAKSGTSALYASIKLELPSPRRLLFEPGSPAELAYITEDHGQNALAKLMFGAAMRQGYDPAAFSHNVAIVRDPRDMLVSSILFRFNRMKLINDTVQFNRLVGMFQQKEQNPRSVSMRELLETAGVGEAAGFKAYMAELLQGYARYLDKGQHHILSFDQMINGDFAALNAYLGLTLAPPPPLEGWVKKINRKGESGDWKQWFCPEDVVFFRDAMDAFIAKYGFEADWSLDPDPKIEPEYCSHYILRLAEARKIDPNRRSAPAEDLSLPSLLSAAEDGKVNALIKLVAIYRARGETYDPQKAAEICEQLGQMGYPRYGLIAYKLFIKQQEPTRAIQIVQRGVDAGDAASCLTLGDLYLRRESTRSLGMELLQRGRSLGSTACAKRLEELASEG